MRLLGLDLLRLLAVVLVLVSHLMMIEGAPAWVQPLTLYGSLGVSLFFVLSGFLVSGLLFSEYNKRGEISVSRFYIRRAWKIYPPFYLLLAFTYVYSRWGLGWKIPDRMIFTEVFFLQNYFPGHWNHTWSLAVEEHFYIALPLVLLTLVKRNSGAANPFQSIPKIVAGIIALVFAVRCLTFMLNPVYGQHTHGFPTHLRVGALFFGVLIAYVYHFHSIEWLRPVRATLLVLGSIVAVGPSFTNPAYLCTVGFTQEYVGCGAILVGVLLCNVPRTRVTGFLATLGSYSYSIYLWHMAIIYWITPRIDTSWSVKATMYLSGAFVVGIGMAWLWELPTLKLRDRWFPSRSVPERDRELVKLSDQLHQRIAG